MMIKRKNYKIFIVLLVITLIFINIDYKESINNISSKISIGSHSLKKTNKLIISKIGLNQILHNKGSILNDVEYSVTYLNESDYPDKEGGKVILAAHSGNSNISYFENFINLNINDEIKLIYNNKEYKYNVVNIYNNERVGYIKIKRNNTDNRLILTTCHPKYKDKQLIIEAIA